MAFASKASVIAATAGQEQPVDLPSATATVMAVATNILNAANAIPVGMELFAMLSPVNPAVRSKLVECA